MNTIKLEDISQSNFNDCISLEVNESEKGFVSSNIKSIAESKTWSFWIPKCIFVDGAMVGFIMFAKDYEDGKLDICRLMIDRKYQRKEDRGNYGTKKGTDLFIGYSPLTPYTHSHYAMRCTHH